MTKTEISSNQCDTLVISCVIIQIAVEASL